MTLQTSQLHRNVFRIRNWEASTSIYARNVDWTEDDFRNLNSKNLGKIWMCANSSRYDFDKCLALILLYVALSGGTFNICELSQQYNCPMRTVHNYFSWKCIWSLLLLYLVYMYMYVSGPEMPCACIYEWTWSKGTHIDHPRRNIKIVQAKSMYNDHGELSSCRYHIFWQSSIQRGRHTQSFACNLVLT